MRPYRFLPALLLSLAVGSWATAAHACSTATYGGNCSLDYGNPSTAFCVFDTSRTDPDNPSSTCPGSSVSMVFWDFGDGNSTWDDSFVGHNYSNPLQINNGAATVHATVFCANQCVPEISRLVMFAVVGCPTCVQMNVGWN